MDLIESEKSHCYNFQCQQGKRQLGKKGRIQMLKLEQIKKSYDGVEILKEMNLEIEDGEIVSILGPSGCGKTTLLNLILGITEADSGKIWFNGEDITNLAMEKRGFNIVFQDYALFPNLNVYKNIVYGLKNRPGISTEKEVEELIELLGLKEHLNKKIDQLSGGQKQRVALARTLVMLTLSDHVLIIQEGKIAQYDTPEEIIKNPGNGFVREFILKQLEIKKNNIYSLFTVPKNIPGVAAGKVQEILTGREELVQVS